ncbi:MAG: ATPase, T2SS/T4P/T4SS family [archaeon]
MAIQVVESYKVEVYGASANVKIVKGKDYVTIYELALPFIETGTKALLAEIREHLVNEMSATPKEIFDPKTIELLKEKFRARIDKLLGQNIPNLSEENKKQLAAYLINETLGLGILEFLFSDPYLEEVVVNSSKEPVWVYHKVHGWLKTNVIISDETQIANYASIIARRVGRQITTLDPLLDAHLVTGDRANATLFPISTRGNTITIRKFARKPWTVVDFVANSTMTSEVAALIWLTMQYEGNILISGGTATGKTSFLQTCLPFIQPNHRIISIEDTRELLLPEFLHWVPLTTREPNPEGKGAISMLDLMVNSLRMRPDRIVVGEIRRQEQAEVLFEAMHTGHSVYSTLHADTAEQTIGRLINPPINIPKNQLDAVDLLVVMFRDRRKRFRRVIEISEIVPVGAEGATSEIILQPNALYRWRPVTDKLEEHKPSIKLFDRLGLYTGLSGPELKANMQGKKKILDWLVKNNITDLNMIGKIIAQYYNNEDMVIGAASKGAKPDSVIGG